jgi:acetyl-CoA/propionyl-CoA carboxylase biotin carboxyl carrier protein
VLVANRGEIALRIMRACREEGLATVAVVTAEEENPLHARYADETVTLVSDYPLPYLDIEAVLRAATATQADAIHPGYGFLAENARFAEACVESGIVFVGPPAHVIATMGDKVQARQAAVLAGVPVVPGSDGAVDIAGAVAFGREYGYPVALKATAGGGGRGFRVVHSPDEMEAAWQAASGEAERYFNDPTVYAERYIERPRHIEIQVMADQHGNVVALGERDCSIQRRHQKLVEESPSPVLPEEIRSAMNETVERLGREVGYVGAGTVEFLYSDGDFYFLEMNTRIQVEHPVTEAVTGIDLVREQLRVAAGKPLSFQRCPELRGHAIEVRVNAEDPARQFSPSPGTLTEFQPPAGFGVRVDTGFVDGGLVDPRFDNLVAKLIVWGRDRAEAMSRLSRALADFRIGGVATTIPLFQALLRDPGFLAGEYDTGYLERSSIPSRLTPFMPAPPVAADDASLILVEVNGQPYRVRLPELLAAANGTTNARAQSPARKRERGGKASPSGPAGSDLTSPMQGKILAVKVQAGQRVALGEVICVVEAMKMENEVSAHRDGVVAEIRIEPGQSVKMGEVIAVIEQESA